MASYIETVMLMSCGICIIGALGLYKALSQDCVDNTLFLQLRQLRATFATQAEFNYHFPRHNLDNYFPACLIPHPKEEISLTWPRRAPKV
jgi:hypothetical protein